eukprot:206608_1
MRCLMVVLMLMFIMCICPMRISFNTVILMMVYTYPPTSAHPTLNSTSDCLWINDSVPNNSTMAGHFAIDAVNPESHCNAFVGNGTSTSWYYECDPSTSNTSTVIKYMFSGNLECTGFPDYTKYYRDP